MKEVVKRSLNVVKVDKITFMGSIVGVRLFLENKESEIVEEVVYGRKTEVEKVNNRSFDFGVMISKPIDIDRVYRGNAVKVVIKEIIDSCLTVISKEVFGAVNDVVKMEHFGVEIGYLNINDMLNINLKSYLKDCGVYEKTDGIAIFRKDDLLSFASLEDMEDSFTEIIESMLNSILEKMEF